MLKFLYFLLRLVQKTIDLITNLIPGSFNIKQYLLSPVSLANVIKSSADKELFARGKLEDCNSLRNELLACNGLLKIIQERVSILKVGKSVSEKAVSMISAGLNSY